MKHYRCRNGFTLIEVMVVLIFTVIAAAMFIPRFSSFQRAGQARDTARSVMALVREAREIAVEQQRPVSIVVDPQTRMFDIQYEDYVLPQGGAVSDAVGGSTQERPRAPLFFPEPLIAQIETDPNATMETAGTDRLVFTPDGRVPNANIMIAYDTDRFIVIAVRRQGTSVRIEDPTIPSEMSAESAVP